MKQLMQKRLHHYLLIFLVVAILALGGGYFFVAQNTTPNIAKDAAGAEAEEWYELATNTETEVLAVQDDGPLYKVVLRNPDSTTTDVYVTKDGTRVVDNPRKLENVTEQLRNVRAFYTCMRENDLVFHGQFQQFPNETAQSVSAQMRQITATQLNVLPLGNIYLRDMATQCSAQEINQGVCPYFSAGNQTFPSFVVRQNQLVFASAQDLANFTGCTAPGLALQ